MTATTKAETHPYIGRFAPSPSGPLHLGSLFAALVSWLHARHHNGQWFLRIDDLDSPRVAAGASTNIQQTLEAFGLEWDGPIQWQSERLDKYQQAADALKQQGLCYPCNCSRKQLEQTAQMGDAGRIYPGHCAQADFKGLPNDHAVRIRVKNSSCHFEDAFQGPQHRDLEQQDGDFVLWRRDGIASYHLATVLDDHDLGVTHCIRGIDLLPITGRQIYLQQQLGLHSLHYGHFAVLENTTGQKLSKQNKAKPLLTDGPIDQLGNRQLLVTLLDCLFENAASHELLALSIDQILDWAICNWPKNSLSKKTTIPAPSY